MKMLQFVSFLTISILVSAAHAGTVKMNVPALQGTVQSADLRIMTLEPYIGCSLHDGAELVNGQQQDNVNTQLEWLSPTSVQFQTQAAQVKLTKWFTSHGACYAGVHILAADSDNQIYERYLHLVVTPRMDTADLQKHVDSPEWSQEAQAAFQNVQIILFYGGIELK